MMRLSALIALPAAFALLARADPVVRAQEGAQADSETAHFERATRIHLAQLTQVREEQRLLEPKLEVLRRLMPPVLDPELQRGFDDLAARAGLVAPRVRLLPGNERVPLEDGQPSPVALYRVEVSGRGAFGRVHQFLTMVPYAKPARALESLRLQADTADAVDFTARFAAPVYTGWPQPAPTPPPGASPAATGGSPAERAVAEEAAARAAVAAARAALHRQQAFVATVAQLVERARPRLLAALAAVARDSGTVALTLTEVRFDGAAVLNGLVGDAAARTGLEPALRSAGFDVADVKWSSIGSCQAFSVTARLQATEEEPPVVEVTGNGAFNSPTSRACGPGPASPP